MAISIMTRAVCPCSPGTTWTIPNDKGAKAKHQEGHSKGCSFLIVRNEVHYLKKTIIVFSILFLIVLSITTATNHYFIPPSASYLGNSSSHIVHTLGCSSGRQIKEENRVYFESITEALDKNYRPCKICNPK